MGEDDVRRFVIFRYAFDAACKERRHLVSISAILEDRDASRG